MLVHLIYKSNSNQPYKKLFFQQATDQETLSGQCEFLTCLKRWQSLLGASISLSPSASAIILAITSLVF